MRSSPFNGNRISASTVWRDALGPGYAVGATEGLLRVVGHAAALPYRVHR